jgi:CheY-like chemotaxis protein
MLESSVNASALGEVIIEEADDGSTALEALQTLPHNTISEMPPEFHREDDTSAFSSKVDDQDDDISHYQIDIEAGGRRQKKKTAESRFDVVFIDYVMNTMNGPEAVQIMRRDMKFSGGIIGVTGNALQSDLDYFQQCGADLVITKPLTNKKLMDAVLSVMREKRRRIRM